MIRRGALLGGILLGLVACGSISFHREELMALVDDQRASYNLQAGMVNRACQARALPVAECQSASDAGQAAVTAYRDLRTRLLTRESVDSGSLLNWLLLIAKAVGAAYGIPIPMLPAVAHGALGAPAGALPPPMPLMP